VGAVTEQQRDDKHDGGYWRWQQASRGDGPNRQVDRSGARLFKTGLNGAVALELS
jgi:hypothetical protein